MNLIERLAQYEPETDPQRRGAQVLLAVALQAHPGATAEEAAAYVRAHLVPEGEYLDPDALADVARIMTEEGGTR